MPEVVERKSKGIDAPKCKNCGKRHWGTCADQTSGGYLAGTASRQSPAKRLAVAKAIVANPPKVKARKAKRK